MQRSITIWRIEKRFLFLLFFIFIISADNLWTQVKVDTSEVMTVVEKSPRGAVIRSALIPGWGQLYNRQKFKAVLVFGAEIGLIVNSISLNQLALKSNSNLEREFYQSNRNLSLWWFFGIYLLNLLDAFVDAHLWNFDTGPDLAMFYRKEKLTIVRFCCKL